MKIGIITQWFRPEPSFIVSSLADGLVERGHEVRVLTGFPNYPSGRVYPGFKQRWNHRSRDGGVAVRRVPLYASHDNSGLRRAANYLSYAATSSVAGLSFLAGVDIIYVYLTPATVYAAAGLLRRLRGIPSVIHLEDMWPESVTESSMAPRGVAGRAAERVLHRMMRQIYRSAAGIAVIAPSMRDVVIERGADPAKVRVVFNWTDESLFRPVTATDEARAELGHRGRCTVMYSGTMGPFQNLPDSIRAAAHTDEIDLVLVGSGIAEEAARQLTAELDATNIRFLGRRDPSDMAALYAAADYQLVTLTDVPVFRGTMPSKVQAALACGAPLIASVPGDCADLVARNGLGFTCPPEDWKALAGAMRDAAALDEDERTAVSAQARAFYEAQMSRRVGIELLEDMFEGMARGPRKARISP